jgi:hypothetical protein
MGTAIAKVNSEATFTLKNGDEIDLDFSFDQFSPNPSFVQPFVMQFVCTPSENPIKYFEDWINTNSIAISPNVTIEVDGFELEGQAKLSSNQNSFVRNQGQQTQFNILFEPFGNTFFDKAKSKNLSLFVKPKANNPATPVIRYVTERNSKLEDVVFLVVSTQFIIESSQLLYNTFDAIKEAISTGFDSVSAAIKTILKIAMNLAYATAILIALNELLKQISEIIFDKPKGLYCLDVWETLKAGCEFLGYNFESSLQGKYKNLSLLVTTTTEGQVFGDPKNDPIPSYSLFDFIERISLLFRGKLKVTNDTVILETEEFYEQNPSEVILNDLYENGEESFNFEELPETINVQYQSAQGDNNYKDNRYTAQFALKTSAENKNFGVENKIDIQLPFALGQRKNEQSSAEKIFNGLFDLLAGLSKSYKVSGGDRIGFLKLEQDIVQVDTLFIRDGEKINTDSNNILQSKSLYEEFYDNASPLNYQFVTVTGRGKDRICGDDTNELINNNIAKDSKGKTIVVTKNIRDTSDNSVEIEYKRRLFEGDFGYINDQVIGKTITNNINNI